MYAHGPLSIGDQHLMLMAPASGKADDLTVTDWIDQFIDLCVGAGSTSTVSGSGDAQVGITLKSLTSGGELKG
jgi:hypothetical protein